MDAEMDDVMSDIYKALLSGLESKVYRIGSVLDRDARQEILKQKIYDKGDFYDNAGYIVRPIEDGFVLHVGSNVKHEPYVLGGKVPSWTPIKQLIEWVQRKELSWVDKRSGKRLTIEQMAYMIRWKIKELGIEPRNVYQTVIDNKEQWINEQLDSIEVRI